MDKKHILVCDDETGIKESLNLILKDNYRISFCNNGQECLELLEKGQKFNLILLDLKMPRLNGLDALRKIKQKDPDMGVIIITGYRSVDTAAETLNAGASDYIVKPFSSKDVIKSVERNIR